MRCVSDPFDDVIPARRGTGEDPRAPGAREPDRVDVLLTALADREEATYWQRQEFFDDHFPTGYWRSTISRSTGRHGWFRASTRTPVSSFELRPVELAPDGPLIGRLLIRWEDTPFATLLVEPPDTSE
jgi:hypothetical protein